MIGYKFHISEYWDRDGFEILGSAVGSEYTSHYLVANNGFVEVIKKGEAEKIPKPFLEINGSDGRKILQALAEALHKAGFIVENDNKERITAQAISEERKEQIEYLRRYNGYIIREVLNKI